MDSIDTPTEKADGAAVFEFEAECRGIIIETWRVSLRDADDLDDEELADRLQEELSAGKAEFVAQVTDEEHDRDMKRESVLRL